VTYKHTGRQSERRAKHSTDSRRVARRGEAPSHLGDHDDASDVATSKDLVPKAGAGLSSVRHAHALYAGELELRPPGAPTMGGTSEQRGYEISEEADRRRT